MDFDLTHEQRQILEYGDAIAQKFDRKYWMDCAEKHVFPDCPVQIRSRAMVSSARWCPRSTAAPARAWSRCTYFWRGFRIMAFRC